MARNCTECEFHNVGYELDEDLEQEVEFDVCEKKHNIFLALPFKCPHFEQYEPQPYVEEFTECDECEYFEECSTEGELVDCRTLLDEHEHYIVGRMGKCKKIKRGIGKWIKTTKYHTQIIIASESMSQ